MERRVSGKGYCADGARSPQIAPPGEQGATVATDPPGPAETGSGQTTSPAVSDPLPEAFGLARGAADAGLGLKLLGGLAVRVVCPNFPPRLRLDQDIHFGCLSKCRK